MTDITMEETFCNNLSERQFKVLGDFINIICNEKCNGYLVSDEVKDGELDCSKCPFNVVYNALNPM